MAESGRTVPPTQRRLEAARARGDVPRSRDLAAASSWIAACAAVALTAAPACASLLALSRKVFGAAGTTDMADVVPLSAPSMDAMLRLSLTPLIACLAAPLLAGILYSGPTFAWAAVEPRLDRMSPASGLDRLLSGERLRTTALDLAKIVVLMVIGATCLRSIAHPALAAIRSGTAAGTAAVRDSLLGLAAITGAAAAAFAIIDCVRARLAWYRKLHMTPREFLQELRETEGDPSLKGRRRKVHREMAEHGMIMAVRDSSFVVVNPTHVAVALRWDEESMEAPEVVASGRHDLARRIIEEAKRAGVPVVHDPGLARTLADLRPGETIPEGMYEAVAAVIRVLGEE